jgi:hypothetical protein
MYINKSACVILPLPDFPTDSLLTTRETPEGMVSFAVSGLPSLSNPRAFALEVCSVLAQLLSSWFLLPPHSSSQDHLLREGLPISSSPFLICRAVCYSPPLHCPPSRDLIGLSIISPQHQAQNFPDNS